MLIREPLLLLPPFPANERNDSEKQIAALARLIYSRQFVPGLIKHVHPRPSSGNENRKTGHRNDQANGPDATEKRHRRRQTGSTNRFDRTAKQTLPSLTLIERISQ